MCSAYILRATAEVVRRSRRAGIAGLPAPCGRGAKIDSSTAAIAAHLLCSSPLSVRRALMRADRCIELTYDADDLSAVSGYLAAIGGPLTGCLVAGSAGRATSAAGRATTDM